MKASWMRPMISLVSPYSTSGATRRSLLDGVVVNDDLLLGIDIYSWNLAVELLSYHLGSLDALKCKLDFRKFGMLCPLAMGYIGCIQDIMYLCSNWLAINLWQGVVGMIWSGDDGVEMILWWDVWTWMPSLIVGFFNNLDNTSQIGVRQL